MKLFQNIRAQNRLAAKQKLKKPYDWHEEIFENVREAVFVSDFNSRFIMVNQAACQLTGYSKKELLQMRIPDLHAQQDLQAYLLYHDRIMNGEEALTEAKILRKDGSKVYVEFNNKRLFIDNIYYMLTTAQDISKRKNAEEAMRASEEKYRNLFENSLMGISTSSPDGHLIQINPAYARMYGYNNPEEMLSEIHKVEQLYVNPEDRKEVLRILSKNDFMEPKEIEALKRDGTRFFVLVSARVFRDESGKLIYRQSTHIDITEQKKNHEEIIESKKQLEKLYKHLNDVREDERAEISREIHDELGQALTALKIDLNWTMEKIPADVLIHKKIKSMIDIVSDTIKKVQKISSDLRPGMLDDLGLTASLEWYSKECEKRSNFTCMLALDEIPNLNSKIKLVLFRVFQEGMTNIIRHANAKKVKVKLHSSSSGILLKISDDGIGISKKKTTMKDSLGLIGMKERLREFNGTLEIISSKNNGTGLVINIPIVKQEELCLY
jgi:PAS domain S-box-containing protein